MFGLNRYVDKLFEIKWKFDSEKRELYEDLFFVEFEDTGDGYFKLKTVVYTYMDILSGLEEVDFVLSKNNGKITMEILN